MIALVGKRAVVTGGTRGIGRATVEMFRRAGAEVLAVSRSTDGDLSDPCVSEKAAAASSGPLHALVVSHGVWVPDEAALSSMPPSQWHSTIAQNLEDRKSTRLNSSHIQKSRMPSSA